jgi:hypothetical protein
MADAFKAEGMQAALNTTKMTSIFEIVEAGADFLDTPRSDSEHSNSDIVDFLAEGNSRSDNPKKRDIRATEEDSQKAAEMLADELVRQLNRAPRGESSPDVLMKKAKQGLAGGLRKGALHIAGVMLDRVKTGTTNDGSPAEEVSGPYGRWRQVKYGVNPSSVFVASGQLGNALLQKRIKIRFNTGKMSRVMSALKTRRTR